MSIAHPSIRRFMVAEGDFRVSFLDDSISISIVRPVLCAHQIYESCCHHQWSSELCPRLVYLLRFPRYSITFSVVHGPSFLNLGFAGAPLATAFSYNVVAVLCTVYLIFRPRRHLDIKDLQAISRPGAFQGFQTLLFLGLGGVGESFSLISIG